MKKNALFPIVIIILLFLSACHNYNAEQKQTTQTTETTSAEKVANVHKSTVPTLLIHGYQGTVNSYHSMIIRMQESQAAQKEMTMTVQSDGSVEASGQLSGKKNNPLIQVVFKDNINNEWNQASWLKNVLSYLKNNEKVDQVNLVGHSMGGVDIYRYLGTYGNESELPQVNKYVAIGAPFNDFTDPDDGQTIDSVLQDGPSLPSSRYQDFEAMRTEISPELPVLLIAGQLDKNTLTDGTVPTTSALAIYPLLKSQDNNIGYSIIYGENAQHSMLHENPEVDHLIENFLWQ